MAIMMGLGLLFYILFGVKEEVLSRILVLRCLADGLLQSLSGVLGFEHVASVPDVRTIFHLLLDEAGNNHLNIT